MLKNMDDCASALVHEGFVIVPPHLHNISVTLIEEASDASFELIKFMAELQCQTRFYRKGETDPDVGLVHRTPEEGKDIKYFLHVAHDFMSFVGTCPSLKVALTPFGQEIKALMDLYCDLNFLNQSLLARMCDLVPTWQGKQAEVVGAYADSCTTSIPDGTTTLRGLWYKAKEKHKGARGHYDRGLLTNHLGDFGGTLFGHREKSTGGAFVVSPPRGHILVFLGIKAPILTEGFLKPMWHSASSNPKEDRRALVLFGHVRTKQQINCNKEAFKAFCKDHSIVDGDTWHAERWSE